MLPSLSIDTIIESILPSPPASGAGDGERVSFVLARRRCDRALPTPLPAGRVCVRLGSLVDEAVRRSAELATRLIVMARGLGRLGPAAAALSSRAGRPVPFPAKASSFSLALLPPTAFDRGAASDAPAT